MIVLCYLAFCICAGVIANAKQRSGFGYFMLSLFLSPLFGLLLAIAMPPFTKPIKPEQQTA